ncbi:MAG: formate dehydrogenase accessory sulfurtransferase FdhD [Bacteroidota bacterium]|jgi:FdhD protein
MSQLPVQSIQITKVNDLSSQTMDDIIVVEEPLEIRLGYGPMDMRDETNVSITMRTPGNDFELATGFLYTEGIIKSGDDILSIKYCTNHQKSEQQYNIVRVELKPYVEFEASAFNRNFYMTSACGICGKASIDAIAVHCPMKNDQDNLGIEKKTIFSLSEKLKQKQTIFNNTGGIHASALFKLDGELLLTMEDVGRHNALDKLIGSLIALNKLHLAEGSVLFLSGRASFELLQKSAMAGIKIVCAVGAPSSLAVQTAEEFGITLIGFLREGRFNIYSHAFRIL